MLDRLREQSVQSHKAEQDPAGPGVAGPSARSILGRWVPFGFVALALWLFLGPMVLQPQFQALVLLNKAFGTGQAAGITETISAKSAEAASVAAAQASAQMPVQVALAASQAVIEVDKAQQAGLVQVLMQELTAGVELSKQTATIALMSYENCKTALIQDNRTAVTNSSKPLGDRLYESSQLQTAGKEACDQYEKNAIAAQAYVDKLQKVLDKARQQRGLQ